MMCQDMQSDFRTPFPRALVMTVVVVAAAAVGGWLGFGLRKLVDGNDTPSAVATVPTTDRATSTSTPTTPVPRSSTPTRPDPGPKSGAAKVRFVVKKATYVPATSESGARRNRARLAVALSVRNRSSKPYRLPAVRLRLGSISVRRDPQADKAAGPLTQPIPPGSSAVGELRFETAGELTTALAARTSVKLVIDGRRVAAKITK